VETYENLQARIRERRRTWLVTGAAGFIGSHLAEKLLKLGQDVVALDNFSTGTRANLEHLKHEVGQEAWSRFRFMEGDIRSQETCREACRGVDIVLHQAGLGSVPRSIDRPIRTHESNINGFLNMIVEARDAGVQRVVYASSSAVYGDDDSMPKVEAKIGKSMSPYGLSKLVNEQYASVFATCYGFESVGLRYFNVFGPRQDPDGAYASVIPAWIGALLRNQTAYINGDGTISRDFCHVDNVVQANLLAATTANPAALNQAYNVAHGEQTTLTELFDLIRVILAARMPHMRNVRAVHRAPRRGDLPRSLASIDRAVKLLGYAPTFRLKDGLEQTIDWYAANLAPAAKEAANA